MSDERVDRMFSELSVHLESAGGVGRDVLEETLRTFCWLCVQEADMRAQIEQDGPVMDGPNGPRKNPACQLLHQFQSDKKSYAAMLLRELPNEGAAAIDRLADFARK